MYFIETLKLWDIQLLLFINGFHTFFLDGFMLAVSAKLTWIPLYASVLFILIKSKKKEAVWFVLALILCITLADQISSGLIKNVVQRLRPSHEPRLEGLVHLVRGHKYGKFGFVSSHASNAFGFALLTSLFFRNKLYTYAILFWAVLQCYSRMYMGVHYPLDIVGGATVGILAALFLYYVVKKLRPSLLMEDALEEYPLASQAGIPVYVLAICLTFIVFYSIFLF